MATILEFRRPATSPSQDNSERMARDTRETAEVIILRRMRTVLKSSAAS